jgi:hypothetical protein
MFDRVGLFGALNSTLGLMSDVFCQACPRLAIYGKVRKNSLSAQFSVEKYIVLIHLTSKSFSFSSRSHHQAVLITKPSSPSSRSAPPSRPHHQVVPTTKPSPPSRPHQAVATKPSSLPSSAYHQAVPTTKQCLPPSQPTKPTYQVNLPSQPIKSPYQANLSSHSIKPLYS